MKILGPEQLIFGVEDLEACARCAADYGLACLEQGVHGADYAALDGTGLMIRRAADTSLPAPLARSPNLRETRYGVADADTLRAVGAELSRDRPVAALADGVLRSHDDDGYAISFQVSRRRALQLPHYGINVPGQSPGRALNEVAVRPAADLRPRSLSHVVMFTQDKERAERFYAERLGFRTVDVFTNLGPFMRPAGTHDHHTLFLIQAPVVGVEHFTFHLAGGYEVFKAGWDFAHKGYRSFWGPGRHILGSNYFWYFNSPFGGNIEFDADMDQHDDRWQPRRMLAELDSTQTFLTRYADKWLPGGKH